MDSEKALAADFDSHVDAYYYCHAFSLGVYTDAQLRTYRPQYETAGNQKHAGPDFMYHYYLMVYFAAAGQTDKAIAQCLSMNIIASSLKPGVDLRRYCAQNVDVIENPSADGCQRQSGLVLPGMAVKWAKSCEASLTGNVNGCLGEDSDCSERVRATAALLKGQPGACPSGGKYGVLCLRMLGRAGACDSALNSLAQMACKLEASGRRVVSNASRPHVLAKPIMKSAAADDQSE